MPTHSSSIDLDHSGINFGFASRLGMNSELRNVARSMKGRNAGRNPGLKGGYFKRQPIHLWILREL
jgi:hypothetical protein